MPDEVVQLGALAGRIWAEHYPGIISWAQINYMLEGGYAPHVIRAELADGVHWVVARDRDQPCGFAAVRRTGPSSARLDKLYVDAGRRRLGVGRVLLLDAEAWCAERRLERIDLTVNVDNLTAIRAYLRLGFAFEGRVTADIGYGFVMDDYVMGRPVP